MLNDMYKIHCLVLEPYKVLTWYISSLQGHTPLQSFYKECQSKNRSASD